MFWESWFALNVTHFIQGFCWLLFHSLWMGAIIVPLLYLTSKLFNLTANGKKQLFCLGYWLILLGIAVKFIIEMKKAALISTVLIQEDSMGWYQLTHDNWYVFDGFNYYYNRAAIFILICWTFFFFQRLSSWIISYRSLKSYKRTLKPVTDKSILDHVHYYKTSLGIKREISIMQCNENVSPFQLGFRKPLIVIPESTLMGLSEEQIKMVIFHELVHIRNHDYFFHITQELIKTLFFFNPAIMLLSKIIESQREFACDETVVQKTNNTEVYLSTLVRCYEIALNRTTQSVGLLNFDLTMSDRLKALIGSKTNQISYTGVLGLALLWCLLYYLNPGFHSFPFTSFLKVSF